MNFWWWLLAAYLTMVLILYVNYMVRLRPPLPFWPAVGDAITSLIGALLWIMWVLIDVATETWRNISARPNRGQSNQQHGGTEGEQAVSDGPDSPDGPVATG